MIPNLEQIEQKLDKMLDLQIQEFSSALGKSEGNIRSIIDEVEERKSELKAVYLQQMKALEALILPLLYNLMKNPTKEYIHWPNRTETINQQISKIISDGFASYLNEAAGIFSEFVFNAKLSFFQHTKVSPPITSIGLSTGDLVAGTQDGLVLKGDSGYWNKKYNLSKESDLKQLSVVYSGSVVGDAKIDPGIGLVLIKNGIIIK